jgi:hypothetical protein
MRKMFIMLLFLVFFSSGDAMAALLDNGDETVTDTVTGLMWQKATAHGTYTWQSALSYCENLTLVGHTDWRLPNRNELQSLVDYSRYSPAIDPLLASDIVSPASSNYWSSTTYAISQNGAWFVSFYLGDVRYGFELAPRHYVRAVRSGQSGSCCNLVISKSGGGSGTVTSSPAGISCGNQCTAYFNSITPTTLTAQADANSVFMGWSGCDSVTEKNCIVAFNKDRTVKAFFESNTIHNQLDWINIRDDFRNDIQLKVSSLYLYADLNRRLDFSWANYPGNDLQFLRAIYSRDASNSLRSKDRVLEYAYVAQSAKNFVAFDLKDTLKNAIRPNHIVYDREEPWFRTAYDAWTPSYFGEIWKEVHIFGLLNFGSGIDSDTERRKYYKKIIEYAVLQPYIGGNTAKGTLNNLYSILVKNPALTGIITKLKSQPNEL